MTSPAVVTTGSRTYLLANVDTLRRRHGSSSLMQAAMQQPLSTEFDQRLRALHEEWVKECHAIESRFLARLSDDDAATLIGRLTDAEQPPALLETDPNRVVGLRLKARRVLRDPALLEVLSRTPALSALE